MVQMHTIDQRSGLRIEGGALSPGKWGHVAVSIDGSGHASLVVDGKKVAQGDFQGIVPLFLKSLPSFSYQLSTCCMSGCASLASMLCACACESFSV